VLFKNGFVFLGVLVFFVRDMAVFAVVPNFFLHVLSRRAGLAKPALSSLS
jgi:hypothetical protein